MAIYAVCLGMTLAVAAESREEAIEKARTELQDEIDHGVGDPQRVAWNFDLYDVSEIVLKEDAVTFK
jgi:hypothetical protein